MADELTDKKITQTEANNLMAPMELDLTALFKVMKNDIMEITEDFEGNPDDLINTIMRMLGDPGSVQKSLTTTMVDVMTKYVGNLKDRY